MSDQVVRYRFFIASPSGLDDERRKFFDVVNNFNQYEALPEGVYFEPIGWELTLGGVGRPQAQINIEIEKCDYFLLLLYDRWGSSPNPEGQEGHSSATEEEYAVALRCLTSDSHPMCEVIAFFKNIDSFRLADPGPQLSKVLDFKRSMEIDKSIFYSTFDNVDIFAERIRHYLSRWLRGIKSGNRTPVNALIVNNDLSVNLDPKDVIEHDSGEVKVKDRIKIANKYSKQGYFTDAEMIYSDLALNHKSSAIYHEYGCFLAQNGLVRHALVVFQNSQKLAQDKNDDYFYYMDLANCGQTLQSIGELRTAESIQKECLQHFAKTHDNTNMANAYVNLASIRQRLDPDFDQTAYWQKAIDFSNKSRSEYSVIRTTIAYAQYLISKKLLPEATKQLAKAESMSLRKNHVHQLFQIRLSKLQIKYQNNENIEIKLKSLIDEFKNFGLLSLTAKSLYFLGTVLKDNGKLEEAIYSIKEGINYFIYTGSVISIADGYMRLASIAESMNNFQLKKCYLDIAQEKYRHLGIEDIFYRCIEEDEVSSGC